MKTSFSGLDAVTPALVNRETQGLNKVVADAASDQTFTSDVARPSSCAA